MKAALKFNVVNLFQETLSESEDDDGRPVREHAAGRDGEDAGRAAGEDLRPRGVPGPSRSRRQRVWRETGKGLLTLSKINIAKVRAILNKRE